ncbi:MAG: cardiolipin synthase ClsB [Pseudomonadota bacterium]
MFYTQRSPGALKGLRQQSWIGGHRVALLEGGRALFPAMIEAIDRAQQWIQLETYIFDFHGHPLEVARALAEAATRGVEVRVLVDGAGTPPIPKEWQAIWDRAGVQWQVFSPLGHTGFWLPSQWRRMHRKLLVVDQRTAFCGGINVLDDWQTLAGARLGTPRLDFALQFEGPLVQRVAQSMTKAWWRLLAGTHVKRGHWQSALQLARQQWKVLRPHWKRRIQRDAAWRPSDRLGVNMLWLERDNVRHRTQIERAYLQAIASAQSRVTLAHAYFVPSRRLRKALTQAVQRGVTVRVLVQGQFENFMQYHAARPIYPALIEAGVSIHEYQNADLHAKVAVIDGRWSTIGSSNLDPLSLLLAREANVWVDDPTLAVQLEHRLQQAIEEESHTIELDSWKVRPWRLKCGDWLAFSLMRLALILTGKRY